MIKVMQILTVYIIIINFVTFVLYGIDKSRAKKDLKRIKESTLLGLGILGAPYGAVFGMNIFSHKIKNLKFIYVNYISFVVYTALLLLIF